MGTPWKFRVARSCLGYRPPQKRAESNDGQLKEEVVFSINLSTRDSYQIEYFSSEGNCNFWNVDNSINELINYIDNNKCINERSSIITKVSFDYNNQ